MSAQARARRDRRARLRVRLPDPTDAARTRKRTTPSTRALADGKPFIDDYARGELATVDSTRFEGHLVRGEGAGSGCVQRPGLPRAGGGRGRPGRERRIGCCGRFTSGRRVLPALLLLLLVRDLATDSSRASASPPRSHLAGRRCCCRSRTSTSRTCSRRRSASARSRFCYRERHGTTRSAAVALAGSPPWPRRRGRVPDRACGRWCLRLRGCARGQLRRALAFGVPAVLGALPRSPLTSGRSARRFAFRTRAGRRDGREVVPGSSA